MFKSLRLSQMTKAVFEHQPKIYRPEDIKFRGEDPYLDIVLGQMAIELALKNVGSVEKPIWIAWFDPKEAEIKQAGKQALIDILDEMGHLGLALTPFSSKSLPMIYEACAEVNLPILTLAGSRDQIEVAAQVGDQGQVYSYFPITSPDQPKYLGFDDKTIRAILKTIENGKQISIIDDVYSSGATIKAVLEGIKTILGSRYDDTLIEVVTVAREGVIENGDDLPPLNLGQPLTFEVFIPEVVGDLRTAVDK